MTEQTRDILRVKREGRVVELGGIEELLVGDLVDFIIGRRVNSPALYIGSNENFNLSFIERNAEDSSVCLFSYEPKKLRINQGRLEPTSKPSSQDVHQTACCCTYANLIQFALKHGGYDDQK